MVGEKYGRIVLKIIMVKKKSCKNKLDKSLVSLL